MAFFLLLSNLHKITPNQLKKTVALILCFTLLLNVLGFYGIFLGVQFSNNFATLKQLDDDLYNRNEEVTIKLPLTIPYMNDQEDYQRVDGTFQHNGEFYRLVKQKYAKDTLTIICIKDLKNKKIQQVLNDYVKTFSETATTPTSQTKISFSFLKDYIFTSVTLKSASRGWENDQTLNSFFPSFHSSFLASIIHPPERN